MKRAVLLCLGVSLSGCTGTHLAAPDQFGQPTQLSCVPYARAVSGINLSGNAWQWWDEAAGLYPRTQAPALGAVLVFEPVGSMVEGHLAVVTYIKGSREILVEQSNWLPDRIERDQPVIDVSARNDWTAVRVFYEPTHAMGRTVYATYGFILPR